MITTRRDEAKSQDSTTRVLHEMLASRAEPALPPVKIIDDIKSIEDYVTTAVNKTVLKKHPHNLPVENRELILSEDDLKKINETQSFHVVLKIMIEGELHYVKMNVEGSAMSPIEAGISSINRFFVDELAAPSRAVYKVINNKAVYFGVASRALPNFKSLIDDPLTDENLNIEYLKNVSGEELRKRIEELDREDEDYTNSGKDINQADRGKKIQGSITIEDLQRFHKIKVIATIIELDHFMEEDDGHRGNIGNGNFDDDCKLWKITYLFKEANTVFRKMIEPIDWSFRKPNEKTFQVTTADLENSPDLKDDTRFIWCTRTDPYPKVIESMRAVFKQLLHLSQNAYNRDEINLYKRLKDHPVYRFTKNKMYLRMILPDARIFSQLLKLHLSPTFISARLNNNTILNAMSDELTKRQDDFREKLVPSQQFSQFLGEHGDYAMKWIESKYKKYNADILKKIELHKNELNPGYTTELLVDLKKLRESYQTLVKAVKDFQLIYLKSNTDLPRVRWTN